jgi:hypothetical protein
VPSIYNWFHYSNHAEQLYYQCVWHCMFNHNYEPCIPCTMMSFKHCNIKIIMISIYDVIINNNLLCLLLVFQLIHIHLSSLCMVAGMRLYYHGKNLLQIALMLLLLLSYPTVIKMIHQRYSTMLINMCMCAVCAEHLLH